MRAVQDGCVHYPSRFEHGECLLSDVSDEVVGVRARACVLYARCHRKAETLATPLSVTEKIPPRIVIISSGLCGLSETQYAQHVKRATHAQIGEGPPTRFW